MESKAPKTNNTAADGETFFEIALKRTNTFYNNARKTVLERGGTAYESAREGINEGLKRSNTLYKGASENVTAGLRRSGTIVGDASNNMMKRASTFTQSLNEGDERDPETAGQPASPRIGMLQRTGTLLEKTRVQAVKRSGTFLQDAQEFAKVVYNPGAPIRVSIREVLGADIPRVGHSISVIDGRAYIFGGEDPTTGELVDNSLTVVILPSSGSHEADYKTVTARPAVRDGLLPQPRKHHTATVIDKKIYIFGGQFAAKSRQEAAGRVWVFDTFTSRWACLDPSPDAAFPQARYGHIAAASDLPGPPLSAMKTAYKSEDEQLQDEASNAGAHLLNQDAFGTFFVHGGYAVGGEDGEASEQGLKDVWAFDVASRNWMALPPTNTPSIAGTSLAISDTHLFTIGPEAPRTLQAGESMQPTAGLTISHLNIADILKPRTRASLPAQLSLPSLLTEWATPELNPNATASLSSSRDIAATKITSGAGYVYVLVIGTSGAMIMLDITPTFDNGIRVSGLSEGPEIEDDDGTARVIRQVLEVDARYSDMFGETIEDRAMRRKLKLGKGFSSSVGSQVEEAHLVVWGGESQKSGWMISMDP